MCGKASHCSRSLGALWSPSDLNLPKGEACRRLIRNPVSPTLGILGGQRVAVGNVSPGATCVRPSSIECGCCVAMPAAKAWLPPWRSLGASVRWFQILVDAVQRQVNYSTATPVRQSKISAPAILSVAQHRPPDESRAASLLCHYARVCYREGKVGVALGV